MEQEMRNRSRALERCSTAQIVVLCFTLWLPLKGQAFETFSCTESWFDTTFAETFANPRPPDRERDCSKEKDAVRKDSFQIVDGRVYLGGVSRERESPCSGTGVGSVAQGLNPVCYLPARLQIHETIERRTFWLLSTDAAHFRVARSSQAGLTPDQANQVAAYSMDSTTVYLGATRIKGADPKSFEVIFPFGDYSAVNLNAKDKLQRYSYARDNQHLFIGEWSLPPIDLTKVEWLSGHCTGEIMECQNTTYAKPLIGKVGDDILFLYKSARPTLFRNLATADFELSREGFKSYVISGGKRYLIEHGFMEEAKLVAQPQG
jgi:hypothetical protein